MDGVFQDHLAALIHALKNFQLGELRDVLRDRIRRMPFAFFKENHHGNTGDRLGHGKDAEDRILGHRSAARDVFLAVGSLLDHFPVTRQNGYDARKLLLVHLPLHRRMQPLESLR